MRQIEFSIEHGDIADYSADVIALKYAQAPRGADRMVAERLVTAGLLRDSMQPKIGEYAFVGTAKKVGALSALFVGVPEISEFGYSDIRRFMQDVLRALQSKAPGTKHLALTIHGARMGLDEREAFMAQFLVCLAEAQTGALPPALEKITIVERDQNRVHSLRHTMELFIGNHRGVRVLGDGRWGYYLPVGVAADENINHVFVAMSFDPAQDDIFYFGIQRPVIGAGLLCERVDKAAHYRGSIIERIKKQIETAKLIIVDLTGSRPNVYYEAGYAAARGKEPLFIVNETEVTPDKPLQFDIRSDRCVFYRDVDDLRDKLAREINQALTELNLRPRG